MKKQHKILWQAIPFVILLILGLLLVLGVLSNKPQGIVIFSGITIIVSAIVSFITNFM